MMEPSIEQVRAGQAKADLIAAWVWYHKAPNDRQREIRLRSLRALGGDPKVDPTKQIANHNLGLQG